MATGGVQTSWWWRIAKRTWCENLWFGRQKLLIFEGNAAGAWRVGDELTIERESYLCSICVGIQNWWESGLCQAAKSFVSQSESSAICISRDGER